LGIFQRREARGLLTKRIQHRRLRRVGTEAALENLAAVVAPLVVVEAINELAELLEAKGEYYYDYENVKRWVLGAGGRSGNCETCIENADQEWIPDDDVFIDSSGDPIDGPPAHPNCTCELEYKEKRVRVYA